MNRLKYTYLSLALLSAVLLAGCGAASAPPLELPAPVTGQIDVSAPSAEGKATVTGNEGAVTGGSTVLAINDSEVETSLWQVTDLLFNKAHAQSLPGVCDLVGRACAEASSDGSFTLDIDAVVGDQLILVLISSDGEEISDRVTVSVPAGNNIAACGTGFEGNMVAIANSGGVVYSLFEGSEEEANKITFGDQEFQIPGCYAKDIAVIEESSGSILIAVVSSTDTTLWIGRWNGTSLTMALTYTTDIAPYKAAFAGDSTEVIIAGVETSVKLRLISVADGSTIQSLTTLNTEENEVLALDTLGPFADGGYLGIVVARDIAGDYLTFFLAGTLANITSNFGELPLTANAMGIIGNNPVVADASLGKDSSEIRFAISDRQSGDPAFRSIRVGIGANPIFITEDASSFDDLVIDSAYALPVNSNPTRFPHRFVLSNLGSETDAYILTDDNHLWRIENCFNAGALVPALFSLTSELTDPLVIAVDSADTSLMGGNAAGSTADLSSYLLP